MMLYSLTPFCEFCSRRLADYANDCRCGDAPGKKINKLIISYQPEIRGSVTNCQDSGMLPLDHVN